ncbi:hypothetical protein [Agrobacterium sp. NPDC089420]|uniref:hypothetical protein n=1 Tax=Agrobacterium sp. NPDC089420 TaxID=3363918 RepID=UPI00384D1A8E
MSDNTLSIRIISGSAGNRRFCDVIGKRLREQLDTLPGMESAAIGPHAPKILMNKPGRWAKALKRAWSSRPYRTGE